MTPLRSRRVVGVASVLAVALATAAPAVADGEGPDRFSGSAEALALDLEVVAPVDVLAGVTDALGGATGTDLSQLRQKVSLTSVALDSDGRADAVGALLTEGVFDTGLFGSSSGETSGSQAYASRDDGVVSLGVGTVEYVADAAGNVTRSASELAELSVTIAPLFDEGSSLPAEVTAPLQDAVGEATTVVNDLVTELNGALDQVEQVVEDTVGQVVDLPAVLPEELPSVPDVTEVDLLTVRTLWSDSLVETDGELVRAVAESGVEGASLLGGLVEVPAFTYRSWAQTAGQPGTADAGTELMTIVVKVGDDVVGVTGTVLTVGDVVLDLAAPELEGLPADDVLAPVTALLTELVNAAGLSIAPGVGATDVAEDGSRASATTSAFALRLTPLNAAGQADLLDVQLNMLPSAVAVAAAPEVPAAPPQTVPQLPRTGGGAMVLGLAAIAGAALLRRRTA